MKKRKSKRPREFWVSWSFFGKDMLYVYPTKKAAIKAGWLAEGFFKVREVRR